MSKTALEQFEELHDAIQELKMAIYKELEPILDFILRMMKDE